uniref:Ribosomal protein L35 n=1 Tax=Symphyocladia marchantioides TaxID=88360 RepID=UPI0022FDAC17|nr:Ribosomal protein L35 [Symphyocladia marchantioides]WAX03887.1 Ribosomal protein L35 [Symphyocladia marchantioides]
MYKLKTNQSICKRFKVTGNSKMLRRKSCKSHLLQKKNSKRKRKLRRISIVHFYDKGNFINNLPYFN